MAKVVNEPVLPWGLGHRTKPHPWDQWLDGRIWILSNPEDFESSAGAMVSAAHAAAAKRQLKVRTRIITAETVQLQAYQP